MTYDTPFAFYLECCLFGLFMQIVFHFFGAYVGAPVRWIEDQFSKSSRG